MSSLSPSRSLSPRLGGPRCRKCVRITEKIVSTTFVNMPIVFVYALTTWSAWIGTILAIEVSREHPVWWVGPWAPYLVVGLYILLTASYSVAVFKSPGSTASRFGRSQDSGYIPLQQNGQSGILPTLNSDIDGEVNTVTVKSSGSRRMCKKCQLPKPDRAHHCSTCQRCVLKMDHHCPWLATCVGFWNYKAFILFLSYTSLFCWVCMDVAVTWLVYGLELDNGLNIPLNAIILAVCGLVFGIALTGFASWHIWLCSTGRTTIESLERTRYATPLRRYMDEQRKAAAAESASFSLDPNSDTPLQGIQRSFNGVRTKLVNAYSNSIPGITRQEEGEERSSPRTSHSSSSARGAYHHHHHHHQPLLSGSETGSASVQIDMSTALAMSRRPNGSYAEEERERQMRSYMNYLDEDAIDKLPNAFDLGWRRNMGDVFGPHPLLWLLPVCNSAGDGWAWDLNPEWVRERQRLAAESAAQRASLGRSLQSSPSGRSGRLEPRIESSPGSRRSGHRAAAVSAADAAAATSTAPSKSAEPPRPDPRDSDAPPPNPAAAVDRRTGLWNDAPPDMLRPPPSRRTRTNNDTTTTTTTTTTNGSTNPPSSTAAARTPAPGSSSASLSSHPDLQTSSTAAAAVPVPSSRPPPKRLARAGGALAAQQSHQQRQQQQQQQPAPARPGPHPVAATSPLFSGTLSAAGAGAGIGSRTGSTSSIGVLRAPLGRPAVSPTNRSPQARSPPGQRSREATAPAGTHDDDVD